jgi:hypothetical protein
MPTDVARDQLQMAYNALCGALWNLDRVKDEESSDVLDTIFTDLDRLRARLAPIAYPPALIDGEV